MTISIPHRQGFALRLKAPRDWPLIGAALSALVSFLMLFPPWLDGYGGSVNAFGNGMQSAGPALIVVMAAATVALVALAAVREDRRYLLASLVTASNLLVIYIVKVVDVSDLADLYTQLTSPFTTQTVYTGAGLWVGFIFALLTFLFVAAGVAFHWGEGDALTYPERLRRGGRPKAGSGGPAAGERPAAAPGERPEGGPAAGGGPSRGAEKGPDGLRGPDEPDR